MSQIAQEGVADLNLEEIDDYNWLYNEFEEVQDNSLNNTCVPVDNKYNFEYNFTLRDDEIQPFTFPGKNQNSLTVALPSSYLASNANVFSPESPMDSLSSELASATDSLSSDFASTMVLATSSASSAVSRPVKQLLHGMIKKKMRAEGRPETSLTSSPKDSVVDQLTPEEEQKKLEKQQRNKESARRSRQKKKEEEEKLLTDNKRLTSENEELKNDVALLKLVNYQYEEFISTLPGVMAPQQDNGDKICVETGRSKVCDDGAESGDTEEQVLEETFELMNVYGVPLLYNQGSASQRKRAILCQLGDDHPSEMVTSATAYDPERGYTANGGFSIGFQENIVPGISYNVVNQEKLSLTANGGFGIGVQENIVADISDNVTNHKELSLTANGGFNIGVQENIVPGISDNVTGHEELSLTANGGFSIGIQENIVSGISNNVTGHEGLSLTANGGFSTGVHKNVFPGISFNFIKDKESGLTTSIGYSSIQENVFPGISNNVTSPEELETTDRPSGGKFILVNKEVGPGTQIYNAESSAAYQPNTQMYNANSVNTYQLMSHGMSTMTGEVAQTNNPVPMVKQSKTNINPWSTDDGNQSEAEEALQLVQGVFPPPVKKFRFE